MLPDIAIAAVYVLCGNLILPMAVDYVCFFMERNLRKYYTSSELKRECAMPWQVGDAGLPFNLKSVDENV